MKRFKISGLIDTVVFFLYLMVVRWSHQQIFYLRVLQDAFMLSGAFYYATVYMIEVRKVRQ